MRGTWRRRVIKGFGVVVLVGIVLMVALVLRAKWLVERSYADVPEPTITADTSPEGVARGEMLFHSICIECHGGADGRATGKHLTEIPAFLGDFWSANLAHPERGVHTLSDGKIARAIRVGVVSDGRLSAAMNGFGKIGDRDVAALLGYMRSRPPAFAPGGETQPKTRLTLTGAFILTYVAKVHVDPALPSSVVAVPPKDRTVAYGRYMTEVFDCAGCHTEGFGADKMNSDGAFAGGFELVDPNGVKIWTKNITPDEDTGIGRWSVDDFERAVTAGVGPHGYVVRRPMPRFSRLDRTDVEAIYAFLRTVPKVHRQNTEGGSPVEKTISADPPEALFAKLGCVSCHGENAPHRDKIAAAIGKSDDAVADWILDPQTIKPGAAMPSFKTMLDRDQAKALARYVKTLGRERLAATSNETATAKP